MARPSSWLARLLDENAEAGLGQMLLETVIEHMAGRARHLFPCHHEVALDLALTSHRHRRSPSRNFGLQTQSGSNDFVNTAEAGVKEAFLEGRVVSPAARQDDVELDHRRR
jgi:hypothetical protein